MIEDYDTDAQTLYDEIAPHMTEHDFKADYETIGELIGNYNYEEALEICEKIINELEKERENKSLTKM